MELIFKATKQFEEGLRKRFNSTEREKITQRINKYCQLLLTDRAAFFRRVNQPTAIKLRDGLESSLYILRIDNKTRVILSVDDDPIFDQVIITLMAIYEHDGSSKVFDSIAKSLYRDQLVKAKAQKKV